MVGRLVTLSTKVNKLRKIRARFLIIKPLEPEQKPLAELPALASL